MKTVNIAAAQGDIFLRKIEKLPSNLTDKTPKDHRLVVTHSETGHDHIITSKAARIFEGQDPLVCFLSLGEMADLVHLRDYDTHQTLRLTPGIWEVRRQREYTPEGWRRVED